MKKRIVSELKKIEEKEQGGVYVSRDKKVIVMENNTNDSARTICN
ncbi:hypothetical protein [Tepidibacillus fermentans]|uniref:Uncharacterized protein n=1 Tax=Tepidibacillus fermentans TaxID=1281767 RepID=A0A4R3KHU9_9BACI|nr:hypothetical protein [Tepidibacillus fermentans]TCS83055.1 hypothetical protein EDD72_107139 [Tepidibacillus fermentans]